MSGFYILLGISILYSIVSNIIFYINKRNSIKESQKIIDSYKVKIKELLSKR